MAMAGTTTPMTPHFPHINVRLPRQRAAAVLLGSPRRRHPLPHPHPNPSLAISSTAIHAHSRRAVSSSSSSSSSSSESQLDGASQRNESGDSSHDGGGGGGGGDSDDDDNSSVRPLGQFCVRPNSSIDEADVAELETMYTHAKEEFHSGQAIVDDAHFDSLERRLRALDSETVQRGPRCSLRRMRTYSDAVPDSEQLASLYGVWRTLGATAALLAAGGISRILSIPEDGAMAVVVATAAVLGAMPMGMAAKRSLTRLDSGAVVALRGPCPSCGEEVYTFIDLPARVKAIEAKAMTGGRPFEVTRASECHVCGSNIVFVASPLEETKSAGLYGRIYVKGRGRTKEDYDGSSRDA